MTELITLQQTFEFMKSQKERGVAGIYRICGKRKTPKNKRFVKFISTLTHGCEVNGLAAFRYILNHQKAIEKKLEGELLLIINNIQAAENHFSGGKKSNGANWYWCDRNMNRLPEDVLSLQSSDYEVRRTQELYPWYREAALGLDLHSLPKRGSDMIIDIKGSKKSLDEIAERISVPVRIQNVSKVQKGMSVGCLYGGYKSSVPVVEVECGRNMTKKGQNVAQKAALEFLFPQKKYSHDIYKIYWALYFTDISYRLPKVLRNFEKVRKGQIIARNAENIIRSTKESYALFTRTKKRYTNPKDLETQILFLAERVG